MGGASRIESVDFAFDALVDSRRFPCALRQSTTSPGSAWTPSWTTPLICSPFCPMPQHKASLTGRRMILVCSLSCSWPL